jgi:acyl carrier protein
MTPPDVLEVKAFIISALRRSISADGLDAQSIPDDLNLMAHGVIDSLGFVQLLAALESRFGGPIDLADVPPDQLTRLDVLCRRVSGSAVRHHA